jgi:hypothetical protein
MKGNMTEELLTTPAALAVNPDGIPHELKDLRQWVVWYWWHDGKKFTKPLLNARGPFFQGRPQHAKTDKPATWATFAEAFAVYQADPVIAGVGFVFTESDPYCGYDLDGCRDPETGRIESWAWKEIRTFASYTEVSPSGRGVKGIIRAKLPGPGKKHGPREIYDVKRYFTLTGHIVPSTLPDIEPRQAQAVDWYTSAANFASPTARPARARAFTTETPSLADADLITKAKAAKNGEKFSRLWAGDLRDYGGDHSSADLALVLELAFWCNGNAEAIDRLFRQSGLMRDKWERDDYRERTLSLALDSLEAGYNPNPVCLTDEEIRDMRPEPRTVVKITKDTSDTIESPDAKEVPFTAPPEAPPEAPQATHEPEPTQTPPEAPEAPTAKPTARKLWYTIEELYTLPDPVWQVKQHFTKGSLVIAAGPPGVCKTFYALDLALSIATGEAFQGNYEVCPGPVLYVLSEGIGSFKYRLMAWLKTHGLTSIPRNFVTVPSSFDFVNREDVEKITTCIQDGLQADPAFIVIDTVARNFGAGDENNTKDMNKFIKTCDLFREDCAATVLGLHHVGKDAAKKERGSSALRGAADTMLMLDSTDGTRGVLVSCDKQKDAEPFESYTLRKTTIADLPNGKDSLVLEMAEPLLSTRYRLTNDTLKKFLQKLFDAFKCGPFRHADAMKATGEVRSTVSRHLRELHETRRLIDKNGETYSVPEATGRLLF